MSIENVLRLHGHDMTKVVQPDGRLKFVPRHQRGHMPNWLDTLLMRVARLIIRAIGLR